MTYVPIDLLDLLSKHKIEHPWCSSDLPKGWVGIVDKLMSDLIQAGWDKDLHQVKEKFGGLRFYIGATSPEIESLIDNAELTCEEVCHDCGTEHDLSNAGYYVLCKTCSDSIPEPEES